MFILFAVGLFLTLISGMKTIAYIITTHGAMGNDRYSLSVAKFVAKVNVGIVLTSVLATMTMVFHHFI